MTGGIESFDRKKRSGSLNLLSDPICVNLCVFGDDDMSKAEIAKRYLLFAVSLFFSALGVAFTKHGELGVSPISSVANVMSYKLPELSMGTWLFVWNCVLIVGQIALLRKKFEVIQLLQVPLSVLFGVFTDVGMKIVEGIPVESYFMKLIMVFAGIIILAFGISLAVTANVIMNSGEAFVKAISDTIHKDFGSVKIAFDISCVVTAVVLSLLFFDLTVVGVREGTVLSAVLTGVFVRFFTSRVREPIERLLFA